MADITKLASRIDAEFTAAAQKVKKFQEELVSEHRARQERIAQLEEIFTRIQAMFRPRLELLASKFGDRVQVKPTVAPTRRDATFAFRSPVASVNLKFSVSPDGDVRKLIFTYDLQVIPILMEFEKHAELVQPIDAVDIEAVSAWTDERIVNFVRTYLALHENKYYLRDHMVTDPVAQVQFPKFAAAATLERGGQTYYFVSEATRTEFETSAKS